MSENSQQQQLLLPRPAIFSRRTPRVYEPWEKHEYTIFILHGRGDTPSNFARCLLLASTSAGATQFQYVLRNVRLVFLHAGIPYGPFQGNEWFQFTSLKDPNLKQTDQINGLSEHAKYIHELVEAEIAAGLPSEKIALLGLSQGCAQSLFVLLTMALSGGTGTESGRRLGAVVGMSGWMPFSDTINDILDENAPESTRAEPATREQAVKTLRSLCSMTDRPLIPDGTTLFETPVFLGHGTADPKVNVKLGETARNTLQRLGFEVEWIPYRDWGHWWQAPEELDDLLNFLDRQIGLKMSHQKPPTLI